MSIQISLRQLSHTIVRINPLYFSTHKDLKLLIAQEVLYLLECMYGCGENIAILK